MKLLMIAFVMALFASAYSWKSSGIHSHPGFPGKCVVNELVLSPGKVGMPVGQCLRVSCRNANGFAIMQGCGKISAYPPCSVGESLYPNAPYPLCCEMEIICPEGVQPEAETVTA